MILRLYCKWSQTANGRLPENLEMWGLRNLGCGFKIYPITFFITMKLRKLWTFGFDSKRLIWYSKPVAIKIRTCKATFDNYINTCNYCNIDPRLSGENFANYLSFLRLSIPKRDFDAKKTTPNLEVCPESLGAVIEYWYI